MAAPVATTLGARGIIPTRHRLSAGVAGSYSAPPANRIVCGADLVLFVGCDTGDQVTLNWRMPALDTQIVQIEADPLEIGRSYPNTTGLVGDPKATVARLIQIVGRPARDSGFAEEAARIVADWRATMAPLIERDTAPIRGRAAVRRDYPRLASRRHPGRRHRLFRHLDRHDDRAQRRRADLSARGRVARLVVSGLARREMRGTGRAVVCFTGDGGFYYHLAELETARRCDIPVTVVVNNNSGFGQNLTGVRRIAGNRPGRGEELVRFGPTDFAAVARSFGVRGIRVERPAEIAPALAEALAAGEPVVVDVVTDLEPRAPEPWSPGERA